MVAAVADIVDTGTKAVACSRKKDEIAGGYQCSVNRSTCLQSGL